MDLILFLIFVFLLNAEDCACPVIKCEPCYNNVTVAQETKLCVQNGILFCDKQVCEKVENYGACINQKKTGLPQKFPEKKFAVDVPTILPQDKKVGSISSIKRTLSSVINKLQTVDSETNTDIVTVDSDNEELLFPENSQEVVAKVYAVEGNVKIFQNKKEEKLTKGAKIFAASQVTNAGEKEAIIDLHYRETQKARLKINPKSKVNFLNSPDWLLNHGIPFEIVYGGVEVELESKLEKPISVKARELMAYAVNGKFKLVYETLSDQLSVKVTCSEGEVILENRLYPANRKTVLTAGTYSHWYSESSASILSDQEQKVIELGYLTPVFKMSNEELLHSNMKSKNSPKNKKTDSEKAIDENLLRNLANVENSSDEICASPAAKFQQCSWTCEGNAKGASNCQADLPQVSCVRRMCNASGEWGSSTIFSSNFKDLCPASGSRIGSCEP